MVRAQVRRKVKSTARKAQPARVVKRSRRTKKYTSVLVPRPMPWYDPRALAELDDKRSVTLGEILVELSSAKEPGMYIRVHRRACAVVRIADDAPCSCVPLLLYIGARA